MSKYKHAVQNNKNMVIRLSRQSGVDDDLVQSIVWFSKCLIKPGTGLIDSHIFTVVMSTYLGISDQHALLKIFHRVVKTTGGMTVEQFSAILCIFFSRSLDVQIEYAFSLYDANHDGVIDLSDVTSLIKSSKCVTDVDEAEKDETFMDLCTMALETLGITSHQDGISLENFRSRVKENTLVIAILGSHLPPIHVLERFRIRITGKTCLQMQETFGNIRNDLLFEPPDISKPKYYPIMLDIP